jgi:creatinine amidohydrolase
MAAQRTGGIVWPPIYVGYQTMKPHAGFKCTIEVPAEIVMGLANAYLDQCADEGFKLAVLVMGHYGGEHVKALTHVAENWPKVRQPNSDMQVWAFPEYRVREQAPLRGDHAGAYETSLMMYFRPDLVDLSELPTEGDIIGTQCGYGIGGDDPRGATKEHGKELAELIVSGMVEGVMRRLALSS